MFPDRVGLCAIFHLPKYLISSVIGTHFRLLPMACYQLRVDSESFHETRSLFGNRVQDNPEEYKSSPLIRPLSFSISLARITDNNRKLTLQFRLSHSN